MAHPLSSEDAAKAVMSMEIKGASTSAPGDFDGVSSAASIKPGGHVLGSVVKAAVRQLQDVADLTDAVLGGCE